MKKLLKRMDPWSAAWYAALELLGMAMYAVAAIFAYRKRGYFTIGAEAVAFLLPVVYYFVDKIIWALWDAWIGAQNNEPD